MNGLRGTGGAVGLLALLAVGCCAPRQLELETANRRIAELTRELDEQRRLAEWRAQDAMRCRATPHRVEAKPRAEPENRGPVEAATARDQQHADPVEARAALGAAEAQKWRSAARAYEQERIQAQREALRAQQEAKQFLNVPIPATIARYKMGMSPREVTARCRRTGGQILATVAADELRCEYDSKSTPVALGIPFQISVVDVRFCGAAACEFTLRRIAESAGEMVGIFEELRARYGDGHLSTSDAEALCNPVIGRTKYKPFWQLWAWLGQHETTYMVEAELSCNLHYPDPLVSISYRDTAGIRRWLKKDDDHNY